LKSAILALVTVALLSSPAWDAEPTKPELTIVSAEGQASSLGEARDRTARFWLQQLVLSALYRDVVYDSNVGDWEQALQVRPRIQCRYASETFVAIPERRTLEFEEVLVPMPALGFPDYIYLKHGTSVLRLGKYDPWVFEKLKIEAGLSLEETPKVPRWLF